MSHVDAPAFASSSPMPLRRWLLLLLGLAGVLFLASGLRGYVAAWSTHTDDPATVMAAGRSAMRELPVARSASSARGS